MLDAFAGTGVLGFEALSRGASSVTFLELNPSVADALDASIASLDLESRCRVVRGAAAESVLRGRVAGPIDLVLADPPYEGVESPKFVETLAISKILVPDGRVILEASAHHPGPVSPHFELLRTARYGSVSLHFMAPRNPVG